MHATIHAWNSKGHFGFATVTATGQELFVHASALTDSNARRFSHGLNFRNETIEVMEVKSPAFDGGFEEIAWAKVKNLWSGDLSVA